MPADAATWLPDAIVFILFFMVTLHVYREFSSFQKQTAFIVSLLVALLGTLGMNRLLSRTMLVAFSAMGFIILISLAVLIVLGFWVRIFINGSKEK